MIPWIRKRAVAGKQQYTNNPDPASTSIGSARPFAKSTPCVRLFALIVGINKYESPDIPNLLGAVPDADAMRDYLHKHLGVPISQIRNLRDSKATRTAIINGIKAFLFNNDINFGDPILIYYAGHGGSAKAPKAWEVGSTGKVELLIPYDYPSRLQSGRGNHNHGVPDRTLNALLSQLADNKGDNITVILDCCHSGSGTRKYMESTEYRLRGIDVRNIPCDLDQDLWSGLESIGRGSMIYSGFAHAGLRSHVLLAACRADEPAYERTSRGVFTVALLKVLVDIGIDKLSYAGLFDRMPLLSSGQSPQCEGVHQRRMMFDGKVSNKPVCHKIYEKGGRYVMDVGTANGITAGAKFEVHRDRDSGHLLGTVIAREISSYSTILDVERPELRFRLGKDSVALQTSAGIQECVRIHVSNRALRDLVKEMDPHKKSIELVERDDQPEFGMVLEHRRVGFDIFDPDVTKYGLTRMPPTLEPTLEALSPVVRAAARFYWHRRRTSGSGLANFVEIEVTELRCDNTYDEMLRPVWNPTNWVKGKVFNLETHRPYGWRVINKSQVPLYPALFYFDNSDWSITSYYQPPTARGIVDPPLKGQGIFPMAYGDSGSVPYSFRLQDGQKLDVGFLKLFLSREQVDLSHVAQPSPFELVGSRSTVPFSEIMDATELHLAWDTVVVPIIQRRADR